MFCCTVSRGKMLVRWNERPTPSRHRSCGAMPVMSRSLKSTFPPSGSTWPVMRLNSVVLPAPFGPMIALIDPCGTRKLTPPTAWKPPKLFRRSVTSSIGGPPREAPADGVGGAGEAAGEGEEQDDEDRPQDQRPVLGEGHDLLVEPD